MKVSVLLFGGLRESAGTNIVVLDLPTAATVADAVVAAHRSSPKEWKTSDTTATALNDEYVDSGHVLTDGDELALIPPVSGGAPGSASPVVVITEEPLDPKEVSANVRDYADGAVLVFEGVTRNHNNGRRVLYLEYEVYRPMADKKIMELIEEILGRWQIDRVAVAHRVGRVDVGETSMVVAVSAAHREPAFEAGLHFVDRLKQVVPIWKKEYFEGGEVWVGDQKSG